MEKKEMICPKCNNKKIWKSGFMPVNKKSRQRYICSKCGYVGLAERFKEGDE